MYTKNAFNKIIDRINIKLDDNEKSNEKNNKKD